MSRSDNSMPLWGIRAVNRLGQLTRKPGVYSFNIITDNHGKKYLEVNGKRESLSSKKRSARSTNKRHLTI